MTYDGETESITTFAGGAISILIMLAGCTYLVKETQIMFANTKGVNFTVSDQIHEVTAFKDYTMYDFDDSFNFIVGTKSDIDLFDNPYIQFNMYELINDKGKTQFFKSPMQLKKCSKEDMRQFINETALKYYPNSLCVGNK